VLLSVRDADAWWRSASDTIFPASRKTPPGEWRDMVEALFAMRFTSRLDDRDAAVAAYEAHNDRVRREVPSGRLLEWRTGDGWGPLCAALRLPVPDEPFPHVNTTADFLAGHH
jgi:hypothetical protein